MKQNKVSSNFAQDYSNDEKAQARANIDAASTATATVSDSGLMSVADKVKLDSIESGAQANVQANWAQTDVDAPSYIQNKPTIPPAPVQSDWTEANTSSLAYIQHKPGIPAQLTVMRKATDTASNYRYVKVAELVPDARQYYTDAYNFSFICNGPVGTDGYSNEHGIFSVSLQCRYDTNVYYVTAGWAEYGHYTLNSDDAYRNIYSALVLRQFEDLGGGTRVCRKVEVWLKLWTGFSDHDAVSISYLQNTGVHQYRTSYPSKTEDSYPWTVNKGTIWATTTAPTMDSTSPYSYTSQEFEAKDTSVQSNWNETNTSSLSYIQNKPSTSLVQTLSYGDLNPTDVSTLLIDNDDPEGYSRIKTDNIAQGNLVAGPYKGLLDSGINSGSGLGSSTTPLYIDGNGHFVTCDPMQKELTAGYRISIGPGANDTTVIANTMHESVVSSCLIWDTLANNYDYDYYWGTWRVHVHLKAFSDWANADEAIHIRINHVYASEAAQKIKLGSYQVQNYYPYQNGNSYDFTNSHWYYDGNDPYTTATIPDPYGFQFHLNQSTPDRNMPTNQQAHRFVVDTGAPYGDWLTLDASVRFLVPNAAPSSNTIYLLLKGKYAYSYQ